MESEHLTSSLFQLHFSTKDLLQSASTSVAAKGKISSPPLLALGLLQWGTTPIDHRVINGSRGMLTEMESREIYQTFRSSGVVLFDTAEGYGGGTSEKRLGRLMHQEERMEAENRKKKDMICAVDDDATVATDVAENVAIDETSKRDKSRDNKIVMTKFLPVPWRVTHAQFENALRASNKRMGIMTCPIYLLHSPMHLYRDIEYWVESAAICKRKGLLEKFGLSNCSAEEVRRAVEAGKNFDVDVVVNQVHFSLLDFNSPALQEMQRTCDELGVTIIAYNSLGQGLLTDNLTEEKFAGNKPAKMMGINWVDLIPLRTALRDIADAHSSSSTKGGDNTVKKRVSMAQVALCWCRNHNTIPLVGCRSKQQAEDILASLSLHLSSEEVAALDTLALKKCTLDSPPWRRKLFVALAGVVMVACRWLDEWGFGVVERVEA
mmetsp:Transcript_14495/g.31182  ORF Transcript_14495/g.31182 Transcript_14495/m.31182 type:complete len:435 (-) Transcript_14495:26-1330(-)